MLNQLAANVTSAFGSLPLVAQGGGGAGPFGSNTLWLVLLVGALNRCCWRSSPFSRGTFGCGFNRSRPARESAFSICCG